MACETVYMMRHADKSYPDMFKYIGTRALTLYQAMQQKEYEPGDYILGFFGNRGKYGLLLGLWRVTHRMGVHEALEKGFLEDSFEHKERLAPYYHELESITVLDDLRLSLEIEWGKELVWRRVLKPLDIYPVQKVKGCPIKYVDLANVSLVMAELRIALSDLEWKKALGSTCGVYVITDECTVKHYIGSAYGQLGVLQRWSEYSKTGHGGNKKLIELLREDPNRQKRLSIYFTGAFPDWDIRKTRYKKRELLEGLPLVLGCVA